MTRKKGTLRLSSNIEMQADAPLDARSIVPTKADLTSSATFEYAYVGMTVTVQEEARSYILTARDSTVVENWKAVGSGDGGGTIQVDTLPAASAGELGNIYQYIGADGTYMCGHFYKCVENNGSYSWEEIEFIANSVVYIETEPIASDYKVGCVIVYTGEDTENFKKGHLYKVPSPPSTWNPKTWSGVEFEIECQDIWTDGDNIYHSYGGYHYVLDKSTSTWVGKNWNGMGVFFGSDIWTDGDNIYYSHNKVLDKSTSTWNPKTWNGLNYFNAQYIWTDGDRIYYSDGANQYVLDKSTSTWIPKTWSGLDNFYGRRSYIWTDGDNIYYSNSSTQYVLLNDKWLDLNPTTIDNEFIVKNDNGEITLATNQRIFTGTQAEWDALSTAVKKTYGQVNITDDESDTQTVVDAVTDGDMHAVTSNAVYDALMNAIDYNAAKFVNIRKFVTANQTIDFTCSHTGFLKVYAHKTVDGNTIRLFRNGATVDTFACFGTDSSGTELPWNADAGVDATLSCFVKKGDVIKIDSDQNSSPTTNSWYVYEYLMQYKSN